MEKLRSAGTLFLLLVVITGIIYPAFITLVAQVFFTEQANGSLITYNNKIIGSKWIGQYIESPNLFHGRPSATLAFPYHAIYSGGSNLGPTNPLLIEKIRANIQTQQRINPDTKEKIPMDLATSSASGLDPEISPAAAYFQVPRIAKQNQLSEEILSELVEKHIQPPLFGLIGESRVNVLELNRDLLIIKPNMTRA